MTDFPTKDELLNWIRQNPKLAGKREIARAFGIRGADRVELKRMLRELQDAGEITRRKKRLSEPGRLPPVTMLVCEGPDSAGDLFAKPMNWEADAEPPRILYVPRRGDPALGEGDRFLAKLTVAEGQEHVYEARLIKKTGSGPRRMLGIYRTGPQGGRVVPIDKRGDKEWVIPTGAADVAEDGDLVEAETTASPKLGFPRGRIAAIHGDPGAPRQVSLIAMVQHQIPLVFPEEVLEAAEKAKPVRALGKREDLRHLPLVTIDPADARDHDDAVCAAPDNDPANSGGWVVWVAIADVAHYVRPGSALDREAKARGNSTYFPDRVSPMLPERLSADLCSLMAEVDRPCLAVRMTIDAQGNKTSHRFTRGLMRSPASLAYETAQEAVDRDGVLDPDLTGHLRQLFDAWRSRMREREKRQPLELDLPERRIELDRAGTVQSIRLKERLDAHRVIEEFMILANVAAAETLGANRTPLLYRVHEEPNPDKLEALRETVESIGLTLPKGQVLRTRHLNTLLSAARKTEASEMVAMSVLRSQTQAYYATDNFGHFGLSLPHYAHFTSPIRRYSDLLVHRALIRALKLGPDGLNSEEVEVLEETAQHISATERRSMTAERDTVDRYLASFLADREGAEFQGRVAGISRAGVFVKLDETGADGLVPISTLGREYFRFDQDTQTLTGEDSGRVIGLGLPCTVRLVEATPVTGGLIFEIIDLDGTGMARTTRRRGQGRGLDRSRLRRAKAARRRRAK